MNHNVTRNFFRRRYYEYVRTQSSLHFDLSDEKTNHRGYDMVCVVKKQTKLDRKDKNSIISFDKDLQFLFKKI